MQLSKLMARHYRTVALALMAAAFAGVTLAQDVNQLEDALRKAVADAKARAATAKTPAQGTSSIDGELAAFIAAANSAVSCSGAKPAFRQQNAAVMDKGTLMLGYAQQLQSNPALKAQAAPQIAPVMPQVVALARGLAGACQSFAVAPAAAAPAAQPAAAAVAKYEQVASVMKQVFNGGNLTPNAPAVRYAADVDMPARGGTPEALHTYLNSQNGVVKGWYRTNFGLSFADAAAPVATVPGVPAQPPQSAMARREQVVAVMKQVFNGGDLGPNSRAVKHAAEVDMPARGGTPEALHAYLESQNGVVKGWYRTNFGLSFAEAAAPPAATAPATAAESPQDVALDDAAMTLGRTREPLPPLPETAALVNQARQFSDNLGQVVSGMKSAGFDDATTAQLAGIAAAMRFLATDSPYSLQNLANGGAVALNRDELQQLDVLIAQSGAAQNLRRMNTALLDAVREVQPQAVVWKEWPGAPRVQLAAMGELPLNLPPMPEFGRQTVNLSALDRTQRLVMVLKIANALKTASAFSGGSLTLDTKINAVLDSIQQAIGVDPKKAGKDGAKQVMTPEKFREFMKASGKYLKVVSIAKLTTEWIQTLSQLAGWLMPDSIVGFYAQAGGGRTPSTWQIKKDATVTLSLYVVPQVSGGGNVLTPTGLVNKAVDAVKIPFLDRLTGEIGKRLEAKTKEYLKAWVQSQTQQLLARINISSGPLREWTIAEKDTFPLPAKSLDPVEVNDRRVVNMSVIPAAAPQVVLDNPGAFTILGKQAGNVTVRGYVHNEDLRRYFKDSSVLAMSVTVVEDPPPKPAAPAPVAIADPTPKVNNKGQPITVPAGPPHPLVGNEMYMSQGLWDCVNERQVVLVPLPNPWIDPSIIGTNCGAK
jgi:hypothetical protein